MRTVHLRPLAIAAAAVLAWAGNVAAQQKPTGLLNSREVRQLVARAEPADNARLGAHFSALGDRYAAEAKRHISMSQSFVGNPSRNLGTGMSAHCKRLADLNTQSATTVRDLAAYHEKLASGMAATAPKDGARFQGGAGAPEPTSKELDAWLRRPTPRPSIGHSRSTSSHWLSVTATRQTSTSRWRKPIAARASPKPLCITTVSQACRETRPRRRPLPPRCTKALRGER
jgi:hypothetical protein